MPMTEWMNRFEALKDKLDCRADLDAYFSEKTIGCMPVDVLDIGSINIPTGTLFACDPLVWLEDAQPFLQTIPAGTYPVKLCVVIDERLGNRYACIKVEVSDQKTVRYELGMIGDEDLEGELEDGAFCGLLEENARVNPRYQTEGGDWLNWSVPGTDCNLVMCTAGWGDGVCPVYFGRDAEGGICGLYVHFIDIVECYGP